MNEDVLRAVTLGAVDFLDKPLSSLRLRNIWQHTIRRMMQKTSLQENSLGAGGVGIPSPRYTTTTSTAGVMSMSTMSHSMHMGMPLLPATTVQQAPPLVLPPPPPPPPPPLEQQQQQIDGGGMVQIPHYATQSIDSPGTPSAELGGDGDDHADTHANNTNEMMASFTIATAPTSPLQSSPVSSPQSQLGGSGAGPSGTSQSPDRNAWTTTMHNNNNSHNSNTSGTIPTPPLAGGAPLALVKSSSFGGTLPLRPRGTGAAAAAGSQWPQLGGGCVWGTPVGGPLPPSLSTSASLPNIQLAHHQQQQQHQQHQTNPYAHEQRNNLILKSSMSTSSLDTSSTIRSAAAAMAAAAAAGAEDGNELPASVPDGFLSVHGAREEPSGPIGLKLRKSESLLELLNATLQNSR